MYFKCNSCGYKWKSRKEFGKPGKCPKCSSTNIYHLEEDEVFVGGRKKYDRYGNLIS